MAYNARVSEADDRVELVGALCAALPHDLRNLLAVAETSVFVAKKRLDDRQLVADQLDRTSSALRSAQDLLSTTLAFARGEPLTTERHPMNKLFDDALRLVAADDRRRILVDVRPHDLSVAIAPSLFRGALLNLIKNAIEATSGGEAIRLRASVSGGRTRIEVEDDGPGFSSGGSQERSLLGSTKEGGTGLGCGRPALPPSLTAANSGSSTPTAVRAWCSICLVDCGRQSARSRPYGVTVNTPFISM